jgi:hypothetical protein
MYVCVSAGIPSRRLTQSKLTEDTWEAFVRSQQVAGFGWAITPVEGFRHLLPANMQNVNKNNAAAAAAAAANASVDAVNNAATDGQAQLVEDDDDTSMRVDIKQEDHE